MDKTAAKMVRVEMLRMKHRHADELKREDEAYRVGVKDALCRFDGRQKLELPKWFIEAFLQEFREGYVQMALEQNQDRLPGPIVERVSRKVWDNSHPIFDFDGQIAFYLQRDPDGQDMINFRLPPGNLTNTINRNYIAMQEAHARIHRRYLE